MLTLKCQRQDGSETVFDYGHRSVTLKKGDDGQPLLMVETKEGESIDWTAPGNWYVMNDNGRTVAHYWIPAETDSKIAA